MKILMISLDKQILVQHSRVANRMKEYGQTDHVFIIIPAQEKKIFNLSSSVQVFAINGNKVQQFFRLYFLGKKIIQKEKIDLITTQDPFFIGLIGVFLKKRFGVKLEAQIHGDFFGSRYYSALRRWLGRYVVRRADRVRAVGERIKKSLIALGIEENKIEIRPIKVDENSIRNYQPKFDLHKKYQNYEKIFLILGRLEPLKNVSWLIDVFGEVAKQKPNYLLLIIGDGLKKNKLIKQARKKHLEKNIKFEDWTSDPFSYLKTADCLLFPSLSEGYGLVAMEAAAAGLPIIMTNVGVANYELKPGLKVKIVPAGDKDKFIEAI